MAAFSELNAATTLLYNEGKPCDFEVPVLLA
jgi:hypothetical protein